MISDPCSGLSTSCKQGETAPISPQDHYKHARHEQDKEEEEKDKEDKENDEDNEDEVDEDAQGESDDDPTKSEFSEFLIWINVSNWRCMPQRPAPSNKVWILRVDIQT